MIWYVLQFSIEFSRVYTFNEFEFLNKFGLFVSLMYTIFPWIFTILYFQQNQILSEFGIFVHLMYWIFHWIFTIWLVLQFSIKFSRNCTFNEFEFFYKFKQFGHLIFNWIFTILYFQRNQISQQVRIICTSFVHNFPLNFHDLVHSLILHRIFTNL